MRTFLILTSVLLLAGCSARTITMEPGEQHLDALYMDGTHMARQGNVLFISSPHENYMEKGINTTPLAEELQVHDQHALPTITYILDRMHIAMNRWDTKMQYPSQSLLQMVGEARSQFWYQTPEKHDACRPVELHAEIRELTFSRDDYKAVLIPVVSVVVEAKLYDRDKRLLHQATYAGYAGEQAYLRYRPIFKMGESKADQFMNAFLSAFDLSYVPLSVSEEFGFMSVVATSEAVDQALQAIEPRVAEQCAAETYPHAVSLGL